MISKIISAVTAWAVLALLSPASASAQEDDKPVLTSSDSAAYYVARLAHLSPFQDSVRYEVYFVGRATAVPFPVGVDSMGRTRTVRRLVSTLVPGPAIGSIQLRSCLDEVCRPLRSSVRVQNSHVSVRVDDQLTGREDVFLTMAANTVTRTVDSAGTTRPNPDLNNVLLPKLGDKDNEFLMGRPSLRAEISPLTQEVEGDDRALAGDFEGEINRFGRTYRLGLTYSGSVSSDEDLSFNNLRAGVEYERNLAGLGDFIPLTFSVGGESDQSFDVANVVGKTGLEMLLPFNLNFSPPDEGYIPNTSPLVGINAQVGWKVREEGDKVEAAAAPDNFGRLGYSVRWKLPLARNLVLRTTHDGTWVFPDLNETTEYHPMSDVGLEYRVGDVTYFVGYQTGEAAPLYKTIRTTSAGIVIGIR